MLPIYKDPNQNFMLMQSKWASELNPMLNNPMTSMQLLKNIDLIVGDNVINHRLGRQMQGWIITDINGVSQIYRSEPFNKLTLTLNSSAPVTVTLAVF